MQLLIATSNPNKLKEYRQLLRPWRLITAPAGLSPRETGTSFKQNAIIKAKYYGQKSGMMTLCDDTGLEIKALNNFPGIYSNRFAKGDFAAARKKILSRVKADRRASFVCVLALYFPDTKKVKTFTGTVSGVIAPRSRGRWGFGYDPIFYLPRLKKTFGELSLKEKSLYSHRSLAAKKLIAFLKNSR
ncbi:RdgB/HAM1 family non-canonical purine NTP pyrophosphatase [Patescibacteria group bacterium]|nr:RdgB/HAM1 family non-canonical purine NTP pyrophosphatase [Patescibacteria group bacterium]